MKTRVLWTPGENLNPRETIGDKVKVLLQTLVIEEIKDGQKILTPIPRDKIIKIEKIENGKKPTR